MLTKQKPLTLSIIIPVFNEENYLGECLDSIAAQSKMPDEVIVVDNNSTDNSMKIAAKYPFVKIVREHRQGIVSARNRGFNTATSELLGRIDADSVLPVNWVEEVHRSYQFKADFALTGSSYFRNLRIAAGSTRIHDFTYYFMSRFLLGHHTLFGSNMVLPAKAWSEVENDVCDNLKYHEDTDLSLHLVNCINIIKSDRLICGISYRAAEKPGGLALYILRWLGTIRHGWQINSRGRFRYSTQLKNYYLKD